MKGDGFLGCLMINDIHADMITMGFTEGNCKDYQTLHDPTNQKIQGIALDRLKPRERQSYQNLKNAFLRLTPTLFVNNDNEIIQNGPTGDKLLQVSPETINSLFKMFIQDEHFVQEFCAQSEDSLNWIRLSEELKNNRNIVLEVVRQNGSDLEHASNELKNDKEIVLEAVLEDGNALQFASDRLKADVEVVLRAIQQNIYALQYASSSITHLLITPEFVKKNSYLLQFASENIKKDEEVVLAAIQQDWRCLQYASDELKQDKEFILAAIQQDWRCLQYASDELKQDKEFILAAIQQDWRCLQYASDELKQDKEIVLTAIQKNWRCLQYASDELKQDKEIVLAAIQQDGRALLYTSDELKQDREITLIAVQQNRDAFQYASDELKQDREIGLAALQQNWRMLRYASNELKQDKEVALAAIRQSYLALRYVSQNLKNDKEIVLTALQQNGDALQYASNELKNDKEIVLIAVQQNGDAFRYASDELKQDREIALAAFRKDENVLPLILQHLQEDEQFVLKTIEIRPKIAWNTLIGYANNLTNNAAFLKKAIQVSPCLLEILEKYKIIDNSSVPNWLEKSMKMFNKVPEIQNNIKKILLIHGDVIEENRQFFEGLPHEAKTIALAMLPQFFDDIPTLQEIVKGLSENQGNLRTSLRNAHSSLLQSIVELLLMQEPSMNPKETEVFFKEFIQTENIPDRRGNLRTQKRKIAPSQLAKEILYIRTFLNSNGKQDHQLLDILQLNHEGRIEQLSDSLETFIQSYTTLEGIGRSFLNSPRFKELIIYLQKQQKNKEELFPTIDTFLQAASGGQEAFKMMRYAETSSIHISTIAKNNERLWEQWKHLSRATLLESQGKGVLLEVSDQWEDLLSCGTDVEGSCQRVDGEPELTKCLLAYVIDGKNRLLCVKDNEGKIVGRSILRILLKKDRTPALFLESYYGDKEYENKIETLALEVAEELGVELYQAPEERASPVYLQKLISLGSNAPYEYSDTAGNIFVAGVFPKGVFSHTSMRMGAAP